MNTKRYSNGVKWLEEHGFAANGDKPCYQWVKAGVVVCFDNYLSEWCAYATFNAGWLGDYCATPKSAIKSLHEVFEREKRSLLKQAQACFEDGARLDKILENESKMTKTEDKVKERMK